MHYRLLWLIGFIWCWQELNCQEGRSFNSLKNNAIDAQSTRNYNANLYMNKLIDRLNNNPSNSINFDDSHSFKILRKKRSELIKKELGKTELSKDELGKNELIKRKVLGEKYPSDANSNKTYEEAIKFLDDENVR